jgi:predicted nucleic acid-binding protein
VTVVVDADVVIGALDASDRHSAQARRLFTNWQKTSTARLMSVVNLSEVLVAPAGDAKRLRRARAAISLLGIAVHRADETIAVEAARLRGTHPISLPDAYCLATAARVGAAVASFDENVLRAAELEAIERDVS